MHGEAFPHHPPPAPPPTTPTQRRPRTPRQSHNTSLFHGAATQGDMEKEKGLGVSALMDRTKAGITKSQTGFFNIVALPLFKAFCKVRVRGRGEQHYVRKARRCTYDAVERHGAQIARPVTPYAVVHSVWLQAPAAHQLHAPGPRRPTLQQCGMHDVAHTSTHVLSRHAAGLPRLDAPAAGAGGQLRVLVGGVVCTRKAAAAIVAHPQRAPPALFNGHHKAHKPWSCSTPSPTHPRTYTHILSLQARSGGGGQAAGRGWALLMGLLSTLPCYCRCPCTVGEAEHTYVCWPVAF